MQPHYSAPDGISLYHGDCRAVLASLPAESVDCVVTSPPYLGLRKYEGVEPSVWGGDPMCEHEWQLTERLAGNNKPSDKSTLQDHGADGRSPYLDAMTGAIDRSGFCHLCGAWLGCYGLEPTIAAYVAHTVEVCAAIWRVLKPSGVMFWNVGDGYNSASPIRERSGDGISTESHHQGSRNGTAKSMARQGAIKPKDLMLIPYRVAIALQEAGWYVRSAITWAKKSCMPESVTDRPTCATEMIWLLSKQDRYYYDAEAVREEQVSDHGSGNGFKRHARLSYCDANGPRGNDEQWQPSSSGRNLRNWWLLGPEPLRESHYAAFPSEIPRRAILAGSSERGCCPTCGKPWERVTEKHYVKSPVHGAGSVVGRHYETGSNGWDGAGYPRVNKEVTTLGWQPTCQCGEAETVPAVVLDPFVGSGTTLLVARQLGRRGLGIDLSETYLRDIAIPRLEGQPMALPLEV